MDSGLPLQPAIQRH